MQAGSGIAEIVALEISRHEKKTVDEARKRIYLLDSKGLVTKARYESLQEFKKPYAHEHPACPTFLSAIKALKPTAIIGTSGQHGAFTKEGLEELASYQDVRTVVRQISELMLVCFAHVFCHCPQTRAH
jgi:malate dehydrogenase (oxaloacetate-decarboxylating)(NADP+)